jgi:hypothetical protein
VVEESPRACGESVQIGVVAGSPGPTPRSSPKGTPDADSRSGVGVESCWWYPVAAVFAYSEAANPQPVQGGVELGQLSPRVIEESGDLRAFEADGGTFGIVLVVHIDPRRGFDDRVEGLLQLAHAHHSARPSHV